MGKNSRLASNLDQEGWVDYPDLPQARLERYLVLGYEPGADLVAIAESLRGLPQVEHVERNGYFRLPVAPPPDPKAAEAAPPGDHLVPEQWGLSVLNLIDGAWNRTHGYGSIGLIDVGLQVDHPDLRAYYYDENGEFTLGAGGLRAQYSRDYVDDDCEVDTLEPPYPGAPPPSKAGHGTMVAGVAAAAANNLEDGGGGVAGVCWGCALLAAKAAEVETGKVYHKNATRALNGLVKDGVQVVSMSWGWQNWSCASAELEFFCDALDFAEDREVVVTAAVGNDGEPAIDFPASHSGVLAIGGIESTGNGGYDFWVNSNHGEGLDLVAPAASVWSTAYLGQDWLRSGCGDSSPETHPPDDGYGTCDGTSFAAPYAAGLAALVNSINPLLSRAAIGDILRTTARLPDGVTDRPDFQYGYGVPDGGAATELALGAVGGEVPPNRLTPLFSLFSAAAGTHLYTVAPQVASAAILHDFERFDTVGPEVPWYPSFPGMIHVSPPIDPPPRASLYVLTTDSPPYPGAPTPVPLRRLSYDPNRPYRCVKPQPDRIHNRDYVYSIADWEVSFFHEETLDANGIGYDLDGIEGFIYPRCVADESEDDSHCRPPGTERVYRYYHWDRDDYALFPESEIDQMVADGYVRLDGVEAWLGYAYANFDSDGDSLVDGFEILLGTNPDLADTDCDGLTDGEEVLFYDLEKHGYGDPMDGICVTIFADGFETGDTSRWSTVEGLP